MQVVFVDGYKGVRVNIQNHKQPFAIYDLKNDPKELHDLAGTGEKFAELQQKMHDRVLQLRRANPSAPRPYDDVAIPAVNVSQQEGWAYDVYAGPFAYVPDVDELQPTQTGRADELSVDDAKGAVRFRGVFVAPETGLYEVTLSSGSRTFARIHDAELIDADFGFDPGRTYSTTIRLEKGMHPVTVTTLADGDVNVGLEWKRK